jgi:S1-C subfamily serine protease
MFCSRFARVPGAARVAAVALCLLAGACASGPARRAAAIRKVYADTSPCIVAVRFVREVDTPAGPQKSVILCCGILVSPDGLVMTSGAYFPEGLPRSAYENVSVQTDGVLWHKADFRGRDEDTNVAFLQIRGGLTFPCLSFAADADAAVGDTVIAFGLLPERFGYTPVFSTGRINAVLRKPRLLYGVTAGTANSTGGPVLTLRGEVLGIVNRYRSGVRFRAAGGATPHGLFDARLPFVEPATSLRGVIAAPPGHTARSHKGWLGVVMDYLGPDKAAYWKLPHPDGVIVTAVLDDSPAARAGLKADDVVTHLNGTRIAVRSEKDLEPFRTMLRNLGAGAKVTLGVLRDRKPIELRGVLGKPPLSDSEVEWHRDRKLGLTVRPVTYLYAIARRLDAARGGALVINVIAAGPAGLAGLEPGDIIRRVNDVPVGTLDDYRRAVRGAELARDRDVLMQVQRGSDTALVNIRPEW